MAPESDHESSDGIGQRTHVITGALLGLRWVAAAVVAVVGVVFNGGLSLDPWWVYIPAGLAIGFLLGQGAGFLQWWFIRYVIDSTELRIDSGVFTKNSRRMPFERIQSVDIAEPFLARLVGMAELRIEMAGGENATNKLSFLPVDDARSLRRLLLDQIHGRGSSAESGIDSGPNSPSRMDEAGTRIATAPPDRVILGTLASFDTIFAAVGAVLLLVIVAVNPKLFALLGGFLALGSWFAQIVLTRVIQQWGFTLDQTSRGLVIQRGLFSRTSQTIPFARVQGLAIVQPFLWRSFGWYRLHVDVAGYAGAAGDKTTDTSSLLLPIADRATAELVQEALLPGVRVAAPQVAAPSRSRWVGPLVWRVRRAEVGERGFTSHYGLFVRHSNVVPHAKVQSVAIRQGPIARRLRVATLDVHTPDGPVDAEARNFDAATVRLLAERELEHARRARSTAARGVLGSDVDPGSA